VSEDKLQKILDRIRKLYAVARDGRGNQNEAAVAAAQAAKMMAQYQLEEADLIAHELRHKDGQIVSEEMAEHQYEKKLPTYYNWLATGVARVFQCHTRITWKMAGPDQNVDLVPSMRIFGYSADVTVARWTFSYLLDQINRLTDEGWKSELARLQGIGKPVYASTRRRWKDQYRRGMVSALLRKVVEVYGRERAEVHASDGTSLVALKEALVAQQFPNEDFSYKEQKLPVTDAVAVGHVDADKVNVNRIVQYDAEDAEMLPGAPLQLDHAGDQA